MKEIGVLHAAQGYDSYYVHHFTNYNPPTIKFAFEALRIK